MTMAIRLKEPNIFNTNALLGQVLAPIIANPDERVLLMVEAGTGKAVEQRLRTHMTRRRKAIELKGKRPRRFTLHATRHTETHDGIRYDCLVFWQSTRESQMLTEELEDILSHG